MKTFIKLDPWQSSFQKNKRGSDNFYALHEVLRWHAAARRKKSKPDPLYVGDFDFSKAFDRVNIPMLISNLKKQGALADSWRL